MYTLSVYMHTYFQFVHTQVCASFQHIYIQVCLCLQVHRLTYTSNVHPCRCTHMHTHRYAYVYTLMCTHIHTYF